MKGWVKIHRSLQGWEWYQDSATLHLFIHLLILANHKPAKYKGVTVNPGQLITGRKKLSQETGLTERQIRTCIKRLKTTNELTTKTTNAFTLITLTNWAKYQITEEETTNETTSQTPTSDQQTTTNKNNKNNKEVYISALGQIKKEMHEAEAWQQSVCMHLAQYKIVTAKEMYGHIEAFISEIEATGESHTAYSARKHFVYWLQKRLKTEKQPLNGFNPVYRKL